MKCVKWICLFLAAVLCGSCLLVLAGCASEAETDGYRQLTAKELALDTRSLAELVLQSPYVTDQSADAPAHAEGSFEWACDSFNGLRELMRREDAGNVLAQIYNDAVAILAQRMDPDAVDAGIWSQSLLSQPIFDGKRTVELTDFSWASILMYHIADETSS